MKMIRKKNGNFQVYKVVVNDRNGGIRSVMYPLNSGYFADLDENEKAKLRLRALSYFTSWTTFSDFGKIFAFRTLKAAKIFANRCRNSEAAEIWEASAMIAEFPGVTSLPDPWGKLINIKKWWDNSPDFAFYAILIPENTVFCDGLRLVRRRNR